jgi:eukaryotic-like serine/threonine-protein kinase
MLSTSRLSQNKSKSPSEVRLVEVLDAYLAAAQEGTAPARDALLAEHPELAEDLEACLASLEFIRKASLTVPPFVPDEKAVEPGAGETGIGDLGDFRLIAEVGRGGMGVVYQAMQLSLNRRVALKVLPFAAAMDPTQLRRFHTEALAAAQLHHTNIVPVYSVGCERGVHYYAMQFIEGQTLAQAIAEHRRMEAPPPPAGREAPTLSPVMGEGGPEARMSGNFPSPLVGEGAPKGRMGGSHDRRNRDPAESPDRARRGSPDPAETADRRSPVPEDSPTTRRSTGSVRSSRTREHCRTAAALGIQAALALDHAHKFGIVHRDIKPANLLLDVQGNLWITDFGLARLQDDAGLTITGDLLGTLRYMSPEQALAKRGYLDHRTDIYSLGATLYELVTLRPAIDGQDRQEVLRKIAQDEPTPPRRLNPAIPRELETVLLKAMNKEPESRYATARELAGDLERFLENKPIQAKRPSLVQRAAKWSRRHATAVGASALVLVIAIVGLTISNQIIARRNVEIVRKSAELERQRDEIKRALHESEEARNEAEAATHFLVDAFRRADPEQDGRELKVVDLLTSAAAKLDKEFTGLPRIKGELLNAIGLTFDSLGLPAQAIEVLEKARAVRQNVLGPNDDDTLATQNNLGEAYLAAGRNAEALELFMALLKIRESKRGADHDNMLETQSNLGVALARMGDLSRAIPLLERTLAARKSKLGADHEETLMSQNNLGSALSAAGRHNEAIALFEATLKVREATLTAGHPNTLLSRNNLAFALSNAGRIAESIPLIEATLRARESKLGPDHPHTMNSRNNLASAYWRAGQPDRAFPLFEVTLKQRTVKFGPDNPKTLLAQINLGVCYRDVGRPADGARLMEEALRRAQGRPDAMEVVKKVPSDLARAYLAAGEYAKAEPLFREELAEARTAFGPKNPRTARAISLLAWSLMNQQKWSEAEPILREALELLQKTTPDAWSTFVSRSALGESLLGMGRYAEAEPLIVSGYEGLKARAATIPPQYKSRLSEAADRVGRLYKALNQPGKAEFMLRKEDLDSMMPNGAAAFAPRSADGKEEITPR